MPVKRVHPEIDRRKLGAARLWRDDLAKIVKLIGEIDPDDPPSVMADDWEIENVDADLAELADTLHKLRVQSFDVDTAGGRVHLKLSATESSLEILDPDLHDRGLATELQRMMKERRRFFAGGRLFWLSFALAAILFTTWALERSSTHPLPQPYAWFLIVPSAVLFAFSIAARVLELDTKRGAIMYTRTRAEAPTWFQRNKDGLATNLIVSIVFYILGLLTPWIVSLFKK